LYEGDSVGFLEGLMDGDSVVGESVGTSDGLSVGVAVDGTGVGSGVGFFVGSAEGSGVPQRYPGGLALSAQTVSAIQS
jgi:hypothetical protein